MAIKDLAAFAKAVELLGGTYHPAKTKWRWFGTWVQDYNEGDAAYKHGIDPKRYGTADAGVVTMPGCNWDVGIYKHPTKPGVYVPVFDFFTGGHGLVKALGGQELQGLKIRYAAEVTKKKLRKNGYKVRESQDKCGRPKLVATKL